MKFMSHPFCLIIQLIDQMGNDERTFIMIKPDGVQRGLCGDIIKRFEQKGFRLVAMKFMQVRSLLGPDDLLYYSYFEIPTFQSTNPRYQLRDQYFCPLEMDLTYVLEF